MMRFGLAWLPLFLLTTFASGAAAAAPVDPEAVLAAIRDEAYYPEGYRELRAAAAILELEAAAPPAPAEPTGPRPGRRTRINRGEFGGIAPAAAATPQGRTSPAAQPPGQVIVGTVFQPNPEPAGLLLVPCDWNPALTAADPAGELLEFVARRVAFIDHRLRTSPYPAYLFEDLVRDYERGLLALALEAPARAGDPDDGNGLYRLRGRIQPMDDRIVRELEQRRTAHSGALPAPMIAQPCVFSARVAPADVRPLPPSGRAWFIPAIRFNVCRLTRNGPDPWSVASCPGWREVHAQQPIRLPGRQFYQARWPDGARRGDMTFETFGDDPVIVNLRQ